MSTKAFAILTLAFHKEDGDWVGVCQELGTSTFGGTFEQANEELLDLVDLHLHELSAVGELVRFFGERGITLYTDDVPEVVQPPVHVDAEIVGAHRVEVPA